MPTIVMRSHAAALRAVLRDAPRLPKTGICGECGKKRYATRQGAEYVLRLCQWYGGGRKTETRAYYSDECDWWHLTSLDKYVDAAAAAEKRAGIEH